LVRIDRCSKAFYPAGFGKQTAPLRSPIPGKADGRILSFEMVLGLLLGPNCILRRLFRVNRTLPTWKG
jgi:hypothetical protein